MSLDSLGQFYTKLSEDITLMEKLKEKYQELYPDFYNPWYPEVSFGEALRILGEENGYNFTTDEIKKVQNILFAKPSPWANGRGLADGDAPSYTSYFLEGKMDFANAESRLKQWVEFNNENRQKYIQIARTKELTPEQEKIFLFCFFDNLFCPPEKAAHQMNISIEEYDKVKNELYERFGTRERQARPGSPISLDLVLDWQLEEETGVINPWHRIWGIPEHR